MQLNKNMWSVLIYHLNFKSMILVKKYPSFECLRSNGQVVRVVSCEARGPGFDASSDQMAFSLLGYKEVGVKWIQTQ